MRAILTRALAALALFGLLAAPVLAEGPFNSRPVASSWFVPAGGAGAVAVTVTNTTAEVEVAKVRLPPLGPNSVVRVSTVFSMGGTGSRSLRARLGGMSGVAFLDYAQSSVGSHTLQRTIQNRGATNAQVSGAANDNDSWSSAGAVVATGTVDTSVAQDLVITIQPSATTASATLESYLVEVLR